jgi:hypothetical protein
MAFDLEDLGWTRPPPGNLLAFLAAGITLRRMHRRAQRGDDDEPPIRDDDAPAVDRGVAVGLTENENAPDARASNDSSDVLAPTRTSGTAPPPRGGAHENSIVLNAREKKTKTRDSSPPGQSSSPRSEPRACRFCLVAEDDVDASGAPLVRGALVAPCACSGTQKWVHVRCLRQWQHVSVRGGARRASCAVCGRRYRVPRRYARESAKRTLSRWFSPRAADRVASYKRAWWQMATNTVLAQEGVPRLGTPAQLAAVLAATELRIWAQREARGGNKAARFLQAAARKITDAHSAALLAWLAVLGARSAGDAIGGPGGVLDGIVDRLARELRHEPARVARIGAVDRVVLGNERAAPPRDAAAAPPPPPLAKRRLKRFFLWACRRAKASGGVLGALIRGVAQPGARAALRVVDPAQSVVSFVERFPQYRVA